MNYSLAFNSACNDYRKEENTSGTSYSIPYTVYGCQSPGSVVWAYLELNDTAIASTSIEENRIAVTPTVSFDPSSYSVDEGDDTTVTVTPTVTISASASSITEGEEITFTVTANPAPTSQITVNLGFGALPSGVFSGSQSWATVTIDDDRACLPEFRTPL